MPVRIFTIVDLPAPFSPMSATTSPAYAESRMSVRARTPPKRLLMCSSVRIGSTVRALVRQLSRCSSEDLRELFDVAGVVGEGRRHGGFTIGFHRHLAHAAHRDLLALL